MFLNSIEGREYSGAHDTPTHTNAASPLPKKLKHSRHRSSSWGGGSATFYSSTIVPALPSHTISNDGLSSLISSLTAVANSQKVQLKTARPRTGVPKKEDTAETLPRIATNPNSRRTFDEAPRSFNIDNHDDEQDFCPPPVAGYSTINAQTLPPRPKTSGSDKPLRKFKDKREHTELKSSRSQRDFLAPRPQGDLQSPEPIPPIPPRSSYGDESLRSIPWSTNSKLSRKSPFKMFFSSRLGSEPRDPEPFAMPKTSDTSDNAPSSPQKEKESDAQRFSAFVTIGRISTDMDRKESDTKTVSSMSPSYRTDLNENVIPSRRSSLRSGPRKSPRGSRDLKSLNIDQDLIEENHETVQRIRELQQAREKRHSEWRKEARKSEKAAKRMSLPTSENIPIDRTGSVRSSWHPNLTESPQEEEPPQMSARISGDDLGAMPAFVPFAEHEALTPVEKTSPWQEDVGRRRNSSIAPSTTQSMNSVHRHRKRLSDSIKRVGSLRSPLPDDAKGIADDVEAFLASPRMSQKIRHPRTGRTIAFSEVGDPNGFVVFCCVGMGLTRYVTSFYDEIAKTQKLRIITPDRPGVGMTDAMPTERSTPLAWVDDVAVICTNLGIEKFSLLAHSAGAIYALAAALKMPQYVRGRIHLLAPWIPPSQLAASGRNGESRAANLPTAHRILSVLPTAFMKAANSRFLSATSASIEPRAWKDRRKDALADLALDAELFSQEGSLSAADISLSHGSMLPTPETTPHRSATQPNVSCYQAEQLRSPPQSPPPGGFATRANTMSPTPTTRSGVRSPLPPSRILSPEAKQKLYNTTLTHRTWSLATLNANPAVDLIICLERKRPIGFRYTDITRSVVIHHGSNDTRVPLDNVKWLSTAMKRCQLRILPDEGHGLMASASVMSNVLSEVGREWEEWSKVVGEKEKAKKQKEVAESEQAKEKERAMRRGHPRW